MAARPVELRDALVVPLGLLGSDTSLSLLSAVSLAVGPRRRRHRSRRRLSPGAGESVCVPVRYC